MEPTSQSVTANQPTNQIIVHYSRRAHLNMQHARTQPQQRPCYLLLHVTRPSTNEIPKGLRLSQIITSVTLCTTLLLIAEPPASHDVRYYSLKSPGWSFTWHYPDLLRTTHRTTDETPAHREPTGTCSELNARGVVGIVRFFPSPLRDSKQAFTLDSTNNVEPR